MFDRIKPFLYTLEMAKFIFILFFILSPKTAFAEDSVSTSLRIVKDFHAASMSMLADFGKDEGLKADFTLKKAEAEARLEKLKVTEPPGKRRFDEVYSITEAFTESLLASLKDIKQDMAREDKAGFEDALKGLEGVREENLEELRVALKAESPEEEKREPVPVIDQSPYEKNPESPEGPSGIWFR